MNEKTPQTNGTAANGYDGKKTMPPPALRRMAPLILSGYAFNTVLYLLVKALLPTNMSPAPEYCPNDEPDCDRRDLLAFQAVSFVNLSYLGLLGCYSFFLTGSAADALPRTPRGRYFGNTPISGRVPLPEADHVNAVIVIFQGWDFVTSFFFEEHCTMIMMTHHLLAFFCGFFCLWYEVNPYYAVYIGGVCEFSSIFLAVAQTFQYYPPSYLVSATSSSLTSTLLAIESFCQGMFVLTFFLFRIVGWARMSYMFFSDTSYIIKHDLLRRLRPGSGWFLWYLVIISGLLGALQVYWIGGIFNKLLELSNA
eukprot:CAMPEP_0181120580 /NCGR_PEP_ID=MMETSP1071-20121207/24236_1 /TAXON_ID=35127 /ORGANISM="Thalassiosira sp., Strain NH16" /LENGTH=308 /DNA_ID=CAMNT_0023205253 /DNA_START=262 /DNA_END=1188 /DNA_ORIENTATION=+